VYRPVTKGWLCKQLPLLGNDSVNTFPLLGSTLLIMQQLNYTVETWCFYVVSASGQSYNQIVQFCTGRCEERTWPREAEESPLLEAVARERLVKTQQAGRRLSGCCGDLWIVGIGDGSVIACSTKSCKWSLNPFTNSSPVYSHSYYLTIFFLTVMDSNTNITTHYVTREYEYTSSACGWNFVAAHVNVRSNTECSCITLLPVMW
jgi:hypothetical protein